MHTQRELRALARPLPFYGAGLGVEAGDVLPAHGRDQDVAGLSGRHITRVAWYCGQLDGRHDGAVVDVDRLESAHVAAALARDDDRRGIAEQHGLLGDTGADAAGNLPA